MTLYLLRDLHDKDVFKVGIAQKPSDRQRQIENASGRTLEPVVWVEFSDDQQAVAAERFLLSMFLFFGLPGEWFRFDAPIFRQAVVETFSALGRWPFRGKSVETFDAYQAILREPLDTNENDATESALNEAICL